MEQIPDWTFKNFFTASAPESANSQAGEMRRMRQNVFKEGTPRSPREDDPPRHQRQLGAVPLLRESVQVRPSGLRLLSPV